MPRKAICEKTWYSCLSRYAKFLERQHTNGLLLLDSEEEVFDSKFTKQVHNYFLRTDKADILSRNLFLWIP